MTSSTAAWMKLCALLTDWRATSIHWGCTFQLLSVRSTTAASVFIQKQAPAAVPTTSLRTTEEAPTFPSMALFNYLLDNLAAGAGAPQTVLMGQPRAQLDHL